MKILVTGGSGYVGSSLVRRLAKSHQVIVADCLRFGNNLPDNVKLIEVDLTKEIPKLDVDGVIHLAAMSKEPTALFNELYTIELNYNLTRDLARIYYDTRFVFASTCSVYFSYDLPEIAGKKHWEIRKELPLSKETDELNPISPYSITKRAAEQVEHKNSCILRKGTLFGVSPRMRFDLVVNALVKTAFFDNKIKVLKGIFRPLVDIHTVVRAYEQAITGEQTGIYNVVDFNTDLVSLAERVKSILPTNPKIETELCREERNYRADKSKFESFNIKRKDFKKTVMEIWNFLEENPKDKPEYYNR